MRLHSSRCKKITLLSIAAALIMSMTGADAVERIASDSWLSFYESLATLKASLHPDGVAQLNSDLVEIDRYYFGLYFDGVDADIGDLKFRQALSGLNSEQIHALALRYKAEMDKSNKPN